MGEGSADRTGAGETVGMTAGETSSGWYKGLSSGGHAQFIHYF